MSRRLVLTIVAVVAVILVVLSFVAVPRYLDNRAFATAQARAAALGEDYEEAAKVFQRYLDAHPRGAHAEKAQKAIESELPQKAQDRDWNRAKARNTEADYRAYLAGYPDGKWRQQAEDTVAAYKQFTQAYPDHPKAEAAKQQLTLLRRAEQEFASGHAVYLHTPSPATLSGGTKDCVVKYVSRKAGVRGDLLPVYVFQGGGVQMILPLGLADTKSEGGAPLAQRRGELSTWLSDEFVNDPRLDHVELSFCTVRHEGGVANLQPLSNTLILKR